MSSQKVLPVDSPLDGTDSVVQSFANGAEEPETCRSERDEVTPLRQDLQQDIVPAHDDKFLGGAPVKPGTAWSHTKSAVILKKTSSMHALMAATGKPMLREKQKVVADRIQSASKRHSLLDRLSYKLDMYISTLKGQIIALCILGLVMITSGGSTLKAAQPTLDYSNSIWESWTFLADPGSHTSQTVAGLRVISMIITLVGIIYFSVIMGFIVDAIRDKMDSLKKGKSKVAEEGHTLMLGWTDKSISFIRQICLANASEGGGVIVVLAEVEKEELEAELESHLQPEELRGTEVIFRTGTPLLSVDLLKVSAHQAKSIIIMAHTTGDADRSDSAVLRTVLSLKTLPELAGHIVAELRDIDNEPLVRLVGGQQVDILVSHDVIGRLVLMAARSSGLARVFSALLGFEGNEFYVREWPECVGTTFRGLSERFPNAIPLGIKTANGEMRIFPDFDTVIQTGDQILVLAEDDDTYKACPPAEVDTGCLPMLPKKIAVNERILMCGWRRDIRDMIKLLDHLVAPGTEVHMICEEPCKARNKILAESGLDIKTLSNLKLVHHFGNTAIRRHLEQIPLHTFTSMMILADQSREADIMHSDSHSLASLLLIRDLQNRLASKYGINASSQSTCKCISEILDPRTQRTIATSTTILQLSEFIESNELVSCILAMISESRDVRVILDELLGSSGSSFEVETSAQYCAPNEMISFWQLAKRAMFQGEILCGYQTGTGVNETILNPTDKDKPRLWAKVDLIVLRSKERRPIVHIRSEVSMGSKDFEHTSHSRQSKSTYVRQQILEALVREHELANIEEMNGSDRSVLTKAVHSFVEITREELADGDSDNVLVSAKSVRSLVCVARLLADTLEKASDAKDDNDNDDDDDDEGDDDDQKDEENVSEFDMNAAQFVC